MSGISKTCWRCAGSGVMRSKAAKELKYLSKKERKLKLISNPNLFKEKMVKEKNVFHN